MQLPENDPLALALFHARLLVTKLERAERARLAGDHTAADALMSPAAIKATVGSIARYAEQDLGALR